MNGLLGPARRPAHQKIPSRNTYKIVFRDGIMAFFQTFKNSRGTTRIGFRLTGSPLLARNVCSVYAYYQRPCAQNGHRFDIPAPECSLRPVLRGGALNR